MIPKTCLQTNHPEASVFGKSLSTFLFTIVIQTLKKSALMNEIYGVRRDQRGGADLKTDFLFGIGTVSKEVIVFRFPCTRVDSSWRTAAPLGSRD